MFHDMISLNLWYLSNAVFRKFNNSLSSLCQQRICSHDLVPWLHLSKKVAKSDCLISRWSNLGLIRVRITQALQHYFLMHG